MNESEIYNNIDSILSDSYSDEKGYRKEDLIGNKKCENVTDELTAFVMNNFVLDNVIWRCLNEITDIYGSVIFTKGLVYEQVENNDFPLMLIDNNGEKSEVSNLENSFTSI
jgi:hypothetical protein